MATELKLYTKASLVADALSLGSHWVYNPKKLARTFPNGIYEFTDPLSQYHPNRKAGQFTHYGDQTYFLHKFLQRHVTFCPNGWREDWLVAMNGYDGYVDGASKDTINNKGLKPSTSNDLAGASRIGPILDLGLPLEEAVEAARQQTGLTHGDQGVIESAEFFTRAIYAVQDGLSISDAFDKAATEGDYSALDVNHSLEQARKGLEKDVPEVANAMGLTCHLPEAFPLTLFFALRKESDFATTISNNALAGGDNSARGMILGMIFAARDGDTFSELAEQLKIGSSFHPKPGSNAIEIQNENGTLSGVLEYPEEKPKAYAIFAHCFTCGKDFLPEKRITKHLSKRGIATLRIDFAGLGASTGDFKETSFVTNLSDIVSSAEWLQQNLDAPKLLVGHSLGGAAVLAAAGEIPSVKAVATIGAPADPFHVTHLFDQHLDKIEEQGEASVNLAGRKFVIGKRFLDDLKDFDHEEEIESLRGVEVLIMHAPKDDTVALENAGKIFSALKHPKSFIALPEADHLLTNPKDAEYVASLIDVWSDRVVS